tara:strand:- start:964 stop:1722 length:759 start_codon:yes stop_codon:yes gene_type:complete
MSFDVDPSKIKKSSNPFDHWVIDDFFPEDLAYNLSNEFIDFDSDKWFYHDNNIVENKKNIDDWGKFPKQTYSILSYLCSNEFINIVREITEVEKLYPDYGLHGGGWHIHNRGGKLNVHKDYDVHPRLELKRKFNLIVYLSQEWKPEWGGALELWSHNSEKNRPKEKVVDIEIKFNRAILFDTSQNSWHGLPKEIDCPKGFYRKSLAVYYLTDIDDETGDRKRALFAPYGEQENNKDVLEFIENRCKLTEYKR